MNGTTAAAGFYAMDLFCVRDNSLFNGLYQLLPAIWNAGTNTNIGTHSEWVLSNTYAHPAYSLWEAKWRNFDGNNSDICRMEKFGSSVNGTDWNVTIIGTGSRYMTVAATIHGNEKLPMAACFRFAEEVVYSYRTGGVWASRLTEVSIIIIHCFNPDGYFNSSYGRENANGVNLNRDFGTTVRNGSSSGKPYVLYGNFSQPESKAYKLLIDTYQPFIDVSFHEGREWETNKIYHNGIDSNVTQTFENYLYAGMKAYWTNVGHVGTYIDHGANFALNAMIQSTGYGWFGSNPSGYDSSNYPSSIYHAATFEAETLAWSGDYGTRQMLYVTDQDVCELMQLFARYDKLDGFSLYATKAIKSAAWNVVAGTFTIQFNNTGYASAGSTVVYVGTRGKPLYVKINGAAATENVDWTWTSSTSIVSVVGSDNVTLVYLEAVVTVTIVKPTNTSYAPSSVPVEISAGGGSIDKIWWNCKNGSNWIYGSNQTYTVAINATGFIIGTSYSLYAWANNTDGSTDEDLVMFSVAIEIVLTPLEVSLNTPSDGATSTSFTVTFIYTPTVRGDLFYHSELWLNLSGIWQIAAYNSSIIANTTTNAISYVFSANNTYMWNIKIWNSTTGVFASSNYILTVNVTGAANRWQMTFTFVDVDAHDVTGRVTWKLYNGTQLLTYIEGDCTLVDGTYTLKIRYHNIQVYQRSVDTASDGNSTVQTTLAAMKQHLTLSGGGYIIHDGTPETGYVISNQTSLNLTFAPGAYGFTYFIIDVPSNATFIDVDGVNLTSWTYGSDAVSYFINFPTASLTTCQLCFGVNPPELLGDPYFVVTVTLTAAASATLTFYFYRRNVKMRKKVVPP
jgi:hypothetical protein